MSVYYVNYVCRREGLHNARWWIILYQSIKEALYGAYLIYRYYAINVIILRVERIDGIKSKKTLPLYIL
tara:strand:+ start:538 stop:744 length:207 start_codon:yes stop_codon:yes gene_type:complete